MQCHSFGNSLLFLFFCLDLNPSDISVLCHSSEIEQSSDDVHDELVEDDDEEVMLEMQSTNILLLYCFLALCLLVCTVKLFSVTPSEIGFV